MNTTDFIINIGLYLFIGLWTFINNLQYKQNTLLLLDNKHNDLIEKIKKLGFKISELELQNKIRKIKLEEEYREIKELEQMKTEDSNTVNDVVKDVVKELDTDIIDLSEEIYPTKNLNQNIQNKKGWLKTLLFM
jgi:hypothetical protein